MHPRTDSPIQCYLSTLRLLCPLASSPQPSLFFCFRYAQYVLKLRQALRSHAEQVREDFSKQVAVLEGRAAALIEWTNETTSRMHSNAAKAEERRKVASTPSERKAWMEEADSLHQALEREFRAGEKASKAMEKELIQAKGRELVAIIESQRNNGFDHGVQLAPMAAADGSTDVLESIHSRVDAAWLTMTSLPRQRTINSSLHLEWW